MRKSSALPLSTLILLDLLSLPLSLGPVVTAWGGTFLFFRSIWDSLYFPWAVVCAPALIFFLFVTSIFIFRLLIPKLKPGSYPAGFNRGAFAWYCHLALGRSLEISGLRPWIHSFYFTKYIFWRASGMTVAYGVNSSMGAAFVDLSLITLSKGCTVAEGSNIFCHTFVGDKLFLAPVVLEENVFVGMHTIIGPRTKIGKGSWIGASNRVAGNKLPAGTVINDFEWQRGKPKAPAAFSSSTASPLSEGSPV